MECVCHQLQVFLDLVKRSAPRTMKLNVGEVCAPNEITGRSHTFRSYSYSLAPLLFRSIEYHLFFTAHGVLPGSLLAIRVHRLPSFFLSLMMISSSHFSNRVVFTSGSSRYLHLSLHCVAQRPGTDWATTSQMTGFDFITASLKSSSSCFSHGPLMVSVGPFVTTRRLGSGSGSFSIFSKNSAS